MTTTPTAPKHRSGFWLKVKAALWPYKKFIVAALGAIALGVQAAADDGQITSDEWYKILIAGITAIGVYIARNQEVQQ